MNQSAAVVCASGIGDAILFYSFACMLSLKGFQPTIFSDHLPSFRRWLYQPESLPLNPSRPFDLPSIRLAAQPELETIENSFSPFRFIFLQHDNSAKAFRIQTLPKSIHRFYGAHNPAKHGSLDPEFDYVCDRNRSMVENLALAAKRFLGQEADSPSIEYPGLRPPNGLIHRRFKRRIAIHPTSSSSDKMWPAQKFRNLAKRLKEEGYDPIFTVSPSERKEWDAPLFPDLDALASFLYESGAFVGNDSGTGHLASLLRIPHLIIGGTGLQMPLWRTGWLPGELMVPPKWLMRYRILRPYWKNFITTEMVINKFKNKTLRN